MAKKNGITEIYESCKANRDENGVAWMSPKMLAKLIKLKLAEEFPGYKFSVSSSPHAIHGSCTDGPPNSVVSEFADKFCFGGFDGTIDLAYSCENWLLPDGKLVVAASSGTKGSMGYVDSVATDCPKPGAVLVRGGCRYVSVNNNISTEVWDKLVDIVCDGHEFPEGKSQWERYIDGESVNSLCFKKYREIWEASEHGRMTPDHCKNVINLLHGLLKTKPEPTPVVVLPEIEYFPTYADWL